MDPLSDILSLLNARSLMSVSLAAGGDWAVRFPPHEGIKFNAIVKGTCWLKVEGAGPAIRVRAGDCYLLTGEHHFILASDLDLPPADARAVFAKTVDGVAHHGEGDTFLVIGGRVALDADDAALLLDALPPLIHVGGASERAATISWLLQRLASEIETNQPGAALTSGYLAHIMFVEMLRASLASEDRPAAGWLGALADRRIAAAIRLMHADPARRWRLAEFAEAAGMSRSAFAQLFKSVVGAAPLDYLLRWRMRLAGQTLRNSAASVSTIATSLGYESESAFSNAFKRVMGSAPLQYRRQTRRLPELKLAAQVS